MALVKTGSLLQSMLGLNSLVEVISSITTSLWNFNLETQQLIPIGYKNDTIALGGFW